MADSAESKAGYSCFGGFSIVGGVGLFLGHRRNTNLKYTEKTVEGLLCLIGKEHLLQTSEICRWKKRREIRSFTVCIHIFRAGNAVRRTLYTNHKSKYLPDLCCWPMLCYLMHHLDAEKLNTVVVKWN